MLLLVEEVVENGNMKTEHQIIEEAVLTNPILLDSFEEKEKIALSYLPFSIGIETECQFKESFKLSIFSSIPNLIDWKQESEELTFQIPKGLIGLQCLFECCKYMEEHCLLSTSGNHYHIDCTEWIDKLTNTQITANSVWILKELDSWKYKGYYNPREFNPVKKGWICKRSEHSTIEIRIGEMVLDYSTIIKRIIHGCKIVKKLRYVIETSVDTKKLESALKDKQRQIKELNDNILVQKDFNMQEVINNRVVKYKRN